MAEPVEEEWFDEIKVESGSEASESSSNAADDNNKCAASAIPSSDEINAMVAYEHFMKLCSIVNQWIPTLTVVTDQKFAERHLKIEQASRFHHDGISHFLAALRKQRYLCVHNVKEDFIQIHL